MNKLLLSLALTLPLAGFASAADSPAAPPREDVQDVVFLQPEGARRFRFHVQVDGKAPTVRWAAFLDKIFAWYDRDNDGFLNAAELGKINNLAQLGQGFNYVFNGRAGNQQGPQIKDHDSDKDGKISRAEFQVMARKMGFQPLVVQIFPPNRQAELLTDAFYKHVNGKKDGKLSRSDMAGAWTVLLKLDNDEDEIISTQELQQRPLNPYYGEEEAAQVAYSGMRGQPQQPTPSPFIAVPRDNPESAFPQLIQQLRAQKCPTPLVLGLPVAPNLPKFVRDLIQKLDHDSLLAFLRQPPDLEFSISMGDLAEGIGRALRMGQEPPGVVVLHPGGGKSKLADAAKTGSDGMLRVTLPDARLDLGKGQNNNRFDGNATYYLDQFKQAAGDKKELDKMSVQQNPYISFFAYLFEDADRNSDGKLHLDELKAYFDLIKGGPASHCFITVTDQGRALYALVDTNNDMRLSHREILEALKAFDNHDRNKDGAIERTELLRQFRIVTSQGNSGGAIRLAPAGATGTSAGRNTGRGPIWFQRMDRNKDGDVSIREFLGTPEEFSKFDLDNDGLISAAEAQKIEEERKSAKK